MLASELIKRSFNLANIVGTEIEQVSSSQVSNGLGALNDILSETYATGSDVPYYTHLTVPAVSGQEVYSIDGLIEADAITYTLGNIRYGLTDLSREEYFGRSRVENVSAIPSVYYLERRMGGADLYLYYKPSENDSINITGKFALSSVTLNTNVTDVFDGLYLSWLKYKLAERICSLYDQMFTPLNNKLLMKLTRQIESLSVPSMSVDVQNYINPSRRRGNGYTDPYFQSRILKGLLP